MEKNIFEIMNAIAIPLCKYFAKQEASEQKYGQYRFPLGTRKDTDTEKVINKNVTVCLLFLDIFDCKKI